MANIPLKFTDLLEALGRLSEVQENVGSVELEEEVAAGASVQGDREVLGTARGITNRNKQTTADLLTEKQKKIEDLALILLQFGENLNIEKKLRLELQAKVNEQERKLTELQTNATEETKLILHLEEQLIQVRTKLNKATQLQHRQEAKLGEMQTKANEEKQVRLKLEEKLTELQTKVNETQVKHEEKLRELQMNANEETQLRLSLQQEVINIKEEQQENMNVRITEMEVKLEERCADLDGKLEQLTAEEQKGGAEQEEPQLPAEEQDIIGRSLLAACGSRGHGKPNINAVRQLLSLGVDCGTRDKENMTPLHWAAWWGYTVVCRLLLDAGALVNALDDDNKTPLHHAIRMSVIRLLVQRGADHRLRDNFGQSALDLAVRCQHKEVVDYFRQLP